jgi:hypothetical protein
MYILLLSRSMHQVDLSLAALSVFNDDPVYRLAADDLGNGPTLTATPEHLRHTVLGASLAMPLAGGWVLRGETSWSPDTPYSAITAPQGIERSSTLTALLGIDYAWRDWLFTAQATDRRIADWRADYLVPQRAAAVTLSATGTTLQARLTTRLAVTWMPQNGDGSLWQARFTYRPDDHWAIETSIDVLEGQPGGFFGQFRDRGVRIRVIHAPHHSCIRPTRIPRATSCSSASRTTRPFLRGAARAADRLLCALPFRR